MNNKPELVKKLYQSLVVANNGRKSLDDYHYNMLMELMIQLIGELSGLPVAHIEDIMKDAIIDLHKKANIVRH